MFTRSRRRTDRLAGQYKQRSLQSRHQWRLPSAWMLLLIVLGLVCETSAVAEEATFFRVEKLNGKWHLIDPAGQAFYMRGVNHYGDGSAMPWNLQDRYGSQEKWRKSIRDRAAAWGFNYLPPSIGPTAIDPTTVPEPHGRHNLITRTPEWQPQHYAALEFPFTVFLEYPRQYMAGNGLPDVFSAEFAAGLDQRCREVCVPLKDNPLFIGYHFTQNPPWHPQAGSFDQWIDDITKPGMAGRSAWIGLMKQIYGSVERWSEVYGIPIESWDQIETLEDPLRGYVYKRKHLADRVAFMQRICKQWYQVHHATIRQYDTKHLILGDRNTLHLQPLPDYAIRIMKPYVDVLSVNVMGPPEIVYGVLEDATRVWDGPIHLADTGSGIYAGEPPKSTYQARDLAEFEKVYSGMMQMGVEHPQIIGFGWCGYYETPHPGGRSGLVDVVTDDPLADRLDVVQRWNRWMQNQERNFPNQQGANTQD